MAIQVDQKKSLQGIRQFLGRTADLCGKAILLIAIGTLIHLPAGCSSTQDKAILDAGAAVEFFELRAEEIAATRAVVRFRTSLATTCQVEYGSRPEAFDHVATGTSMSPTDPYVLLHEVPLEDLDPATTYHYRARATTPQGLMYLSAVQSFTTLAAASSSLVNVAQINLGARVIERSSNYGGGGDSESWGAAAAFDGQMATEWATAGDGNGAYVVIDLGQTRHLAAVAFRSREMSDGSSIIQSFRLSIGDAHYGPFSSPNPGQRYQFDLVPPIEAQVVRFEAVDTTGGNTGAREIELLAASP